jgi:hypothetical protein
MAPVARTSGTHSALSAHSDETAHWQSYDPASPPGFTAQTPFPVYWPSASSTGWQQGFSLPHSADFWQTTPQVSSPAWSITHSLSASQQSRPQICAVGQGRRPPPQAASHGVTIQPKAASAAVTVEGGTVVSRTSFGREE